MLLLILLILLSTILFPVLIHACIGFSRGVKILLSLIVLFPFGYLMGRPFPGGLRRLGELKPARIPYAYAVNGAFSVLGSVGAMVIAIIAGYNIVLVLAAVMYAAAGLFYTFVSKTAQSGIRP